MERGVFGAPTFFVDDEMFWGGDRLGALTRYLGIA
jgi:2-hydroxychromene-2-carboxylate isomerase